MVRYNKNVFQLNDRVDIWFSRVTNTIIDLKATLSCDIDFGNLYIDGNKAKKFCSELTSIIQKYFNDNKRNITCKCDLFLFMKSGLNRLDIVIEFYIDKNNKTYLGNLSYLLNDNFTANLLNHTQDDINALVSSTKLYFSEIVVFTDPESFDVDQYCNKIKGFTDKICINKSCRVYYDPSNRYSITLAYDYNLFTKFRTFVKLASHYVETNKFSHIDNGSRITDINNHFNDIRNGF